MHHAPWTMDHGIKMLTSHQDGHRCHPSRTQIPPSAWRAATRNGADNRCHTRVTRRLEMVFALASHSHMTHTRNGADTHVTLVCRSHTTQHNTTRMSLWYVAHTQHNTTQHACHSGMSLTHNTTQHNTHVTLVCRSHTTQHNTTRMSLWYVTHTRQMTNTRHKT
jgi:hypothetical protein